MSSIFSFLFASSREYVERNSVVAGSDHEPPFTTHEESSSIEFVFVHSQTL